MRNLSVTIGIPAFNEEKNVTHLLKSILSQTGEGFTINKIEIILDGSTDNTLKEIRKISDARIKIHAYKQQLGKSVRLNQIIADFHDDVLVLMDADVILHTSKSLKNLLIPFSNEKVGMVNGRLILGNRKTFLERAIHISLQTYESYLKSINGGNNVFAVKGAFMGISKKLSEMITLPKDAYADDAFLYFSCLKNGLDFVYARSATAEYQIPKNIADQINQNARFVGSPDNLRAFFGDIVDQEYSRKRSHLYYEKFKSLLRHPILTATIFLINVCSKIKAHYSKQRVQWKSVVTTKNVT